MGFYICFGENLQAKVTNFSLLTVIIQATPKILDTSYQLVGEIIKRQSIYSLESGLKEELNSIYLKHLYIGYNEILIL